MKTTKPILFLMILTLAVLTGCGKSSGTDANNLPQNGGYGYPGAGGYPPGSGVLGAPLPFQVQARALQSNIFGGQSVRNAGNFNGPTQLTVSSQAGLQMGKIYSDAYIEMQIVNGGATGQIQLTGAMATLIMAQLQQQYSGYGYGNAYGYPQQQQQVGIQSAQVMDINFSYSTATNGVSYPWGGYVLILINGNMPVRLQF